MNMFFLQLWPSVPKSCKKLRGGSFAPENTPLTGRFFANMTVSVL
jgi:hypothetical protein